jgi:hypothetical protein
MERVRKHKGTNTILITILQFRRFTRVVISEALQNWLERAPKDVQKKWRARGLDINQWKSIGGLRFKNGLGGNKYRALGDEAELEDGEIVLIAKIVMTHSEYEKAGYGRGHLRSFCVIL